MDHIFRVRNPDTSIPPIKVPNFSSEAGNGLLLLLFDTKPNPFDLNNLIVVKIEYRGGARGGRGL